MPTTRQNVAWVHDRNPKYSAQQILEFLNEVHMQCVHQELEQFYYRDPTTGMPPFLSTQEGVYTYNCPSNCRKTDKIFLEQTDLFYQSPFYDTYFGQRGLNRNRNVEFWWNGQPYFALPGVSQTDALVSAGVLATVTFGAGFDPGTYASTYYHLYWIKANEITTLDDEMQLPDELHFYIRKAISAYMATEDYGETTQDEQTIERIKKLVRDHLTRGAKARVSRTPVKLTDRDYF